MEGLGHYHFGSTQTNWATHHDIDMRAQVHFLNRSIRIIGEKEQTVIVEGNNVTKGSDSWGGQIVVADFTDNDGSDRTG